MGIGHQIHMPATALDALVQFDVLVACEPLVIHAIALKDLTGPASEGHRIHLLHSVDACAERGIAYSKGATEHGLDGLGTCCVVQYIRVAGCSHIVCPQPPKSLREHGKVVALIKHVRIEPHQNVALGGTDAYVHGLGSGTARVVQQSDKGIAIYIRSQQEACAVGAHAIYQQHFEPLMREILCQYGVHAQFYVFLLIIYRYDYRQHAAVPQALFFLCLHRMRLSIEHYRRASMTLLSSTPFTSYTTPPSLVSERTSSFMNSSCATHRMTASYFSLGRVFCTST